MKINYIKIARISTFTLGVVSFIGWVVSVVIVINSVGDYVESGGAKKDIIAIGKQIKDIGQEIDNEEKE